MKKVKEFFKSKYGKLSTAAVSVMSMLTVGAFAEEATGDYSAATSALTTAFEGLKTEALTIFGTIVGIAVVIFGGYWLVKLAMKWFKGLGK